MDAETGRPVPGASVSLLQERARADEEGRFCFRPSSSRRKVELTLGVKGGGGYPLQCELLELETSFLPVAAVDRDRVAVAVVDPQAHRPGEIRLQRVALEGVDAFCIGCHRWNPCLEDASREELVESRKFLRAIFVRDDEAEALRHRTCSGAFCAATPIKCFATPTPTRPPWI